MSYPIKGTFLINPMGGFPSNNFTNKQWEKELDYMLSVGIDSLFFIRGFLADERLFKKSDLYDYIKPQEDLIEYIFSCCDKRKMKVYMGLWMANIDWNHGDAKNEIFHNKILIEEVTKKFGHHTSFYGWYIPHEVGKNILNITDLYSEIGSLCKRYKPGSKVLISPFFHTYVLGVTKEESLSPKQVYREWDEIFSKCHEYIDYCAFQDTSAPIEEMSEYFKCAKEVCDKYKIELWSNVETFERNAKDFTPISYDLLRYKINIVKPFVSNFITFEFSHYLSPQSLFRSARNLYKLYKEGYKYE